jgi:uncharacterized protein YebE (UPF0316 family)
MDINVWLLLAIFVVGLSLLLASLRLKSWTNIFFAVIGFAGGLFTGKDTARSS